MGYVVKRGQRWYAYYQVTDPATGRRKKRGEVAGLTEREAKRLLRKREEAIDTGQYVEPAKMTVAAYLTERWLPAVRAELKPSAWDSYQRNLRLHVLPHIGGLSLQRLQPVHLVDLRTRLLTDGRTAGGHRRHGQPGLKPKTVRNILTIVHKALSDAVAWRLVEVNPADGVDLPSLESDDPAMRTWTADQLSAFLDACEQHEGAAGRYLAGWLVASTTGMRLGELLGLAWSDVDLDAGSARIRRTLSCIRHLPVLGTPKSSKSRRTVSLDGPTVKVLRSWRARRADEAGVYGLWLARDDFVFCHPDGTFTVDRRDVEGQVLEVVCSEAGCGPFHPERFSREFDRMLTRVDLPRIRFHDLRHTYATLGLEAGEHPRVMADRLGHAKTSVTLDIYSHVTPKMDADLADRQARRIFGDR